MNKIIVCSYDEKLLPKKMTKGSVCFDMFVEEDFEVAPGKIKIVTAGFKTYIPIGWHAKVYARSSLPKTGLMLANSTAVYDADYRGDYRMQLYNYTDKTIFFQKYTRLTQIEFAPYFVGSGVFGTQDIPEIEFLVDKKLFENFEKELPSERGTGALGSTGK